MSRPRDHIELWMDTGRSPGSWAFWRRLPGLLQWLDAAFSHLPLRGQREYFTRFPFHLAGYGETPVARALYWYGLRIGIIAPCSRIHTGRYPMSSEFLSAALDAAQAAADLIRKA